MSFSHADQSCVLANKPVFFIVDCDGTLVDTQVDIIFSLNQSLKQFSLDPYTKDEVLEYIGDGIYPLIRRRAPANKEGEILAEFKKVYEAHSTTNSSLYDGWNDVFTFLRKDQLVILSNKPQEFLDAIVYSLMLDKYFKAWYGRESFEEIKPSSLPVKKILERHGVSREQACIIGDMPNDVIAGQSSNIFTIAALYGYGNMEAILDLKPSATIHSPSDLIPFISTKL
jgi:phosphoglycolate phosphatase